MRTDSGTESSGIITRYDNKYRSLAVFTWTFHKFDMCNTKYYWIWKCKKWFTLLASVAPFIYILLGKGLLYFAKWYFTKRNEICTLRNGNLLQNSCLCLTDRQRAKVSSRSVAWQLLHKSFSWNYWVRVSFCRVQIHYAKFRVHFAKYRFNFVSFRKPSVSFPVVLYILVPTILPQNDWDIIDILLHFGGPV